MHVLVEREDPGRALRDRLAAAGRGRGSLVAVTGPAGSGRTALLAALCADAADSGATVLFAASSSSEADFPLGVLGQLMTEAFAGPATPRFAVPYLTDTDCDAGPPVESRPSSEDLSTILLELAVQAPLLICVDDIGQADTESLECLVALARRLDGRRILLVVSDLPTAQDGSLGSRLRGAADQRIQLELLSRAGVGRVVAQRTGTPDDALSARCHSVSGGNPTLLQALLDDCEAAPADSPDVAHRATLGYGDRFQHAVLTCLGRYDETVTRAARAAAVLGESSSTELVSHLIGLAPDRVVRLLAELDRAGLTRHDKPVSPAVRDAVLDDVATSETAGLNRRAAQLLHTRGASARRVARHLLAAGSGPDPMVDVLCQAADEAIADDADFAHRCLEQARAQGADDRRLAGILVRLTGVEWQLAAFSMARCTANVRGALQEIRSGGAYTAAMLRYLLRQSHYADAVEAVTLVGERTGDLHPADLQDLRLLIAVSYPALVDHLGYPEPGPRAYQRTGPAILHRVLTQQADSQDPIAAERLLQAAEPTSAAFEDVESALLALIYSDELGRAAAAGEVMLDRAARTGSAAWRARLAGLHAETALRHGDLTTAVTQARLALRHLPEPAWGVAVAGPISVLLLAATISGDLTAAAEYAGRPLPQEMLGTRYGLHYLYARGEFHLAADRPQAALADFLRCGELMRAWGIDLATLVPWRAAASRANARLNRPQQSRRTGAQPARGFGTMLRHHSPVSDSRYRPAPARPAPDTDRAELSCTLSDLGEAYRSIREHRRIRTTSRQADRPGEEPRVIPLLERLVAESSGSDGATHEGPVTELDGHPALSYAEHRVATLAAAGHTNREIATKLYITMSTVEQHLTRVYRKLNLSGRNALPAAFDRLVARG
ncbi:DNA-binding CsgD family transcriptional regulator [Actinoplanes octamycinicus]|uniref:DNA-binding CsgD family transcriptional regulator n=1 Tax=Actinoplanes octamycinicus TaxID=135948 RepID=A0A7W7GY19_9ACTN|nr:LuxR family transcriptional regulator [Actinoplanes octamycinicus]MBB4740393.1 DNA-binding CsgD family transcriptional regulator [Actinoplanes octamycinicus]